MNRVLTRLCACAVAFCVPFAVVAQGGDAEASSEASSTEASAAASSKTSAGHFHTLVKLAYANDNVAVKFPRQSEFKPASEGKFYPHGSVFRVTASESAPAVFEFGPEALVKVSGDAEFGTREVPIGERTRTVMMVRGSVSVSLPRTMPTGLFTVAYPSFTVKDLAGESMHSLTPSGDGNEAVVHVVTGMLSVEGMHYNIVRMSAADRVRIRTTGESLFTSLRGESGDYKVTLDQGIAIYRDVLTGAEKEQVRKFDYSLTPQCAIKIFRKRSQIGGRMAVSVMTFDPSGEIRNRYTFAEGTAKINFGEEIVRMQDISFKTKSKDKDKGAPVKVRAADQNIGAAQPAEQGAGQAPQGDAQAPAAGGGAEGGSAFDPFQ